MKAMVCRRYGSPEVLRLEDVPTPAPKENELLVKVRAASLNALDWHFLRGAPFLVRLQYGMFRPRVRILGYDIAGCVESVGARVTRFKPGDEVFGGLGFRLGGLAEYACLAEDGFVARKPAGCTFEEAAAMPVAGATALVGLRDKGKVQAGQKVLVNGAAGGVGTFTVQMATAFGADVSAVCSGRNEDLVRSLGARTVIDYATAWPPTITYSTPLSFNNLKNSSKSSWVLMVQNSRGIAPDVLLQRQTL